LNEWVKKRRFSPERDMA